MAPGPTPEATSEAAGGQVAELEAPARTPTIHRDSPTMAPHAVGLTGPRASLFDLDNAETR